MTQPDPELPSNPPSYYHPLQSSPLKRLPAGERKMNVYQIP
jgi:hypothetical protein